METYINGITKRISNLLGNSNFGSSTLVLISSFIVALSNGLAGLYIARSLTVEAYGRVAFFFSIYLYFTLFGGLGLTTKLNTDLSRLGALNKYSEVNQAFYSLLTTRILTALVAAGIGGVLAYAIQDSLYVYIGLSASINLIFDFLTGALIGLQYIKRIVLVQLTQPLSYLLLLLIGLAKSDTMIFLAFIFSFVFSVILAILTLVNTKIDLPRKAFLSLGYIIKSFEQSGQFFFLSLLQMAYTVYAITVLGSSLRYEEAALFAIPLNLVKLIPLGLATIIPVIYYPRLNSFLVKQEYSAARQHFRLFAGGLSILSLFATIIMVFFPGMVIQLLYSSKYSESISYLILLSPMNIFFGIDSLLSLSLVALNQIYKVIALLLIRLLILVGLIAIGLKVTSNYHDTLIALASAYLISALVAIMIQLFLLRKNDFNFPFMPFFLTAALCSGVAFIFHCFLPETNIWYLEIAQLIAIGSCFCLIASFTFLWNSAAWKDQ